MLTVPTAAGNMPGAMAGVSPKTALVFALHDVYHALRKAAMIRAGGGSTPSASDDDDEAIDAEDGALIDGEVRSPQNGSTVPIQGEKAIEDASAAGDGAEDRARIDGEARSPQNGSTGAVQDGNDFEDASAAGREGDLPAVTDGRTSPEAEAGNMRPTNGTVTVGLDAGGSSEANTDGAGDVMVDVEVGNTAAGEELQKKRIDGEIDARRNHRSRKRQLSSSDSSLDSSDTSISTSSDSDSDAPPLNSALRRFGWTRKLLRQLGKAAPVSTGSALALIAAGVLMRAVCCDGELAFIVGKHLALVGGFAVDERNDVDGAEDEDEVGETAANRADMDIVPVECTRPHFSCDCAAFAVGEDGFCPHIVAAGIAVCAGATAAEEVTAIEFASLLAISAKRRTKSARVVERAVEGDVKRLKAVLFGRGGDKEADGGDEGNDTIADVGGDQAEDGDEMHVADEEAGVDKDADDDPAEAGDGMQMAGEGQSIDEDGAGEEAEADGIAGEMDGENAKRMLEESQRVMERADRMMEDAKEAMELADRALAAAGSQDAADEAQGMKLDDVALEGASQDVDADLAMQATEEARVVMTQADIAMNGANPVENVAPVAQTVDGSDATTQEPDDPVDHTMADINREDGSVAEVNESDMTTQEPED